MGSGQGLSAARRLHGVVAALAATGAFATAHACAPPPPTTVQEQARGFWQRSDAICVVRLDRDSLRPSDLPGLQAYALAQGRWQLPVQPVERWKGDCSPGIVHFVDIPVPTCGGGMPPFGTPLVVSLTGERLMTVWTPLTSELAAALRQRADAQGPR